MLNCVIVGGLGPRALELPPGSGSIVLQGIPGVQIHVGDKVWMNTNVERAKQLQALRHGNWSEPMVQVAIMGSLF